MRKNITLNPILFILIFILCLLIPSFISASCVEPRDEKVVYLTFDDGPTPKITEELLDILKEQNTKATFFIVGKEIKGREDILKRIYSEGHGIGLHTFSHDFKTIYKDANSFIEEMDKTNDTINTVLNTNLRFSMLRFPGGSAGRLTQSLYQQLSDKGYVIFDWNVDLKDGVNGKLSPATFVANSKKCMDKGNRRIILAHCNSNNTNTCKALPDIIAYYKEQGYTFKALTPDTPAYFYRIKK